MDGTFRMEYPQSPIPRPCKRIQSMIEMDWTAHMEYERLSKCQKIHQFGAWIRRQANHRWLQKFQSWYKTMGSLKKLQSSWIYQSTARQKFQCGYIALIVRTLGSYVCW
jgi:hypothetical protein